MNEQLTELAFVLDRSGSMGCVVQQTIAGFNRFLEEQQALPGEARLTLVLFDTEILTPVDAVPVAAVAPLNETTYTLGGSTALLDALGTTIVTVGKRIAAMPEDQRPGKVIVAILTDGEENASRKYSASEINEMIRHQTDKYAWEFLFLGANQDAIATAARMGIAAKNAANFACNDASVMGSHASIARKSGAMRMEAMKLATRKQLADLEKPTSQIMEEEEAKARAEKK
jgi:uncharacterized protein YegL